MTKREPVRKYKAGVLDGHRYAWWSSHSTRELAERAARKYKRRIAGEKTGGAGAWDGYIQLPDGRVEAV